LKTDKEAFKEEQRLMTAAFFNLGLQIRKGQKPREKLSFLASQRDEKLGNNKGKSS